MKKLFVSTGGSDPECYCGDTLADCFSELLGSIDVADECLPGVLRDLLRFAETEEDEQGRIKLKFIDEMWDTTQFCYGYETFEEAFGAEAEEVEES